MFQKRVQKKIQIKLDKPSSLLPWTGSEYNLAYKRMLSPNHVVANESKKLHIEEIRVSFMWFSEMYQWPQERSHINHDMRFQLVHRND